MKYFNYVDVKDSAGICTDGIGICFLYLKERVQTIAGLALETMGTSDCGGATDIECRDKEAALHLKVIGIFLILIASAAGVALPLLGRRLQFLRTSGNVFVIAKAFAAGVILATGFVHMLSDAQKALTDDCLPDVPWPKFPFSGFIAMLAALCTLLADFLGTQYYERKHLKQQYLKEQNGFMNRDHIEEQVSWPELISASSVEDGNEKKPDDLHGDGHMHIVGMRAHAASHSHSHPHGHHSCEDETHEHVHGRFGHAHTGPMVSDSPPNVRHIVVSQVLELGIISHSVIIGLSLGVSQSPCTIRPLMGALSFHQFFEGFALGGCVSQAGFKSLAASIMASFFALTTPAGIGLGIGISSIYNANTPRALIVEGIFDSISAGILIYMALVDLIAADFLSKGMCCNPRLQVVSYIALFTGGLMMSALAIWA